MAAPTSEDEPPAQAAAPSPEDLELLALFRDWKNEV